MQSTNSQIFVYAVASIVLVALIGGLWMYSSGVNSRLTTQMTATSSPESMTPTASTSSEIAAQKPTVALVAQGDIDAWMKLGNTKYEAGDYAGARDTWEYVAKNWPEYAPAYMSLADLYRKRLSDFPKAEQSYLALIVNTPPGKSAAAYRELFDLYVNQYKQETSAAENTLKTGIETNPKATDLMVLLAQYYRDRGRMAEAKAQYDVAITAARVAGATELATTLEAERSAF